MKHFETKKQASQYMKTSQTSHLSGVHIFKKIKGMRNMKKPFVIGTEFEWLNQY
jgi:hypothetical protein